MTSTLLLLRRVLQVVHELLSPSRWWLSRQAVADVDFALVTDHCICVGSV